jgi:hypothetical protein
MRIVAPDTNYILHFDPIAKTTSSDLGLNGDLSWLIVGQVIRELDVRKGTGHKTLRRRARQAAQEFERFAAGSAILSGVTIEVFVRTRDFDYEAHGLSRHEGDDRVLADLIEYAATHPEDEVMLLSDDSIARMQARSRGIAVIEASENLKRAEIEDERDAQLREVTDKYRALAETQPAVELLFEGETKELNATINAYDPDELRELNASAVSPEAAEHEQSDNLDPLFAHFALMQSAMSRPNPDYDKQLVKYHEDFLDFFHTSWIANYRTIKINPVLCSRNGVEASGVSVRITLKTNGRVLSKSPKVSDPPKKPKRRIDSFGAFAGFGAGSSYDIAALSRDVMRPPQHKPHEATVRSENGQALVRYDFLRLRQDDATPLDPFYIVFDEDTTPSKGIELITEVRAANMNVVVRSKLLIRIMRGIKKMPALYLYQAGR